MGCGGTNLIEGKIQEIHSNSLYELGINLKDSLVLYFSKKNSLNINIGIYSDIIYTKKKGSEKVVKYKNKKFFLKNNKKKVINNSIIKRYYEIYPHYINYSSVGTDDKFSPNFLLNNNFEKIFEIFGIKNNKNKENKFAICFINNISNNIINLNELNEIKKKFENKFFIYINKNINDDEYIPYENFTIFFKGNEVDYWVENNLLNIDNFDLFMNYKQNSINTNIEIIENYIKENHDKEKEYTFKYKYYEIFDKNGTLISSKSFPLIIISSQVNQNDNENLINIYKENKPKFIEFIQSQIKTKFQNENLLISKIEIFKERIASLLLKTYFISKKKYSLYIPPIKSNILFSLIKFIEQNINKNKENLYNNNMIENIIIMPEINTKFQFYEENKFIYIIMNNSSCFNFAKTLLKKKYKDIFGNLSIKFICLGKNIEKENNINNNRFQLTELNEEILFISEDNLINKDKDNNLYQFYIHSFNDINYFSHILLITNSEGIITYINYFNNRAQIFQNLLKEKGINIKQGLDLITEEKFKTIKNFFSEKNELLLNNIENIKNENIIEFENELIFKKFYEKKIYHQPYLSLKYNKVLSLNSPLSQKFYKNYTINYMHLENNFGINFDNLEHQCLNEISYMYNGEDNYIEFKKDLRCKNCYNKIIKNEGITKDKYIFYICPISKDIICRKCYERNNELEENYPYNLLYIKCKEKSIFNYLPKDNILLFKERINYENHLEIIDEKCDLCNNNLITQGNIKNNFYILVRIIKKNYFLICKNCFELLINDDKDWIFEDKYNYINDFIINYFIDLDNLIFKVVKFK